MTNSAPAGNAPMPSATGVFSRLRFSTTQLICGMPGYSKTLGSGDPGQPTVRFTSKQHGEPERGSAISDGVFPFAGQVIRKSPDFWTSQSAGDAWLAALNGFSWLADLKSLENDAARRRGVGLILDWIETNRKWSPQGWNAATLGNRISNWLIHYFDFFDGADEMIRRRVRSNLARQVVHLDRIALHDTDGAARIVALKGLVYAGLSLEPFKRSLPNWGQQLENELSRQIFPDGGHLDRSPSVIISILRHIVDCRKAYQVAKIECPAGLQQAIDRMVPMVMALRLPDGGLCLFNDSTEGNAGEINVLLAEAGVNAKSARHAPHAGFERVEAGKTVFVMDTGSPPPEGFDSHAHAGALSFELAIGKERMIVNCGAANSDDTLWRDAQRATAAHSTLCLADTNSSLLTTEGIGDRRASVSSERNEQDGQVWIETSHDGYAKQYGFIHRRRIFVSGSGDDVRGEDILEPVDPGQPVSPRPFTIRFHLHPSVKSSMLANNTAALLRLAKGAGWRLRATGGSLDLEDTIYLGRHAEPRRSQQVVIRGETGAETVSVKWAIRRESKS